jgi:hypothetical protein
MARFPIERWDQALHAWPRILKAERGAAAKWPADSKYFLIEASILCCQLTRKPSWENVTLKL